MTDIIPPMIIDDFLPVEMYKELLGVLKQTPLKYGYRSNFQTDPFGHLKWGATAHDARENLADLSEMLPGFLCEAWGLVKGKLGDNVKLIRCYANGYTYGMDGYFHTDSSRQGEITVIMFMVDEWKADWAGELVVMDQTRYLSTLPRPNRAVFVPSNMQHCARSVSRMCDRMRMTLMFKTRPYHSNQLERLSRWLVQHGALSPSHNSGSLHDHLWRVCEELERKGIRSEIALGGGLHSIYGTNSFKHKLFTPTDSVRSMVANIFGREAENLAYLFSILDRPRCLESFLGMHEAPTNTVGSHVFMSAVFGLDPTVLPTNTAFDLCLIEAANLADQDSLTANMWPNLKKFWDKQ